MTQEPHVEDAPDDALPALLVQPPWMGGTKEPPVVLSLKPPREPTVVRWAPGRREAWLKAPYEYSQKRMPEDTDWAELAEFFAGDQAMDLWKPRDWSSRSRFEHLYMGLVMQAPRELGEKLLADERYWDAFVDFSVGADRGAVARHEMAAYPPALHQAKKKKWNVYALEPFLDHAVAQAMIKDFDGRGSDQAQDAWYDLHGVDAVRLTIPDALRKPGPKRERAEAALRSVARRHGHDLLVEAAGYYGDEAVQAVSRLRTDPLDMYPDPLPDLPQGWDPERLPRILLRLRRRQALPPAATRNLLTMLAISESHKPYAGVPLVVAPLAPESLAEFAWALYEADRHPKLWASPGVQYALSEWGDDTTADRLAPIVARWSRAYVWDSGGQSALRLFGRLGTDSALRHLDRLASKAEDQKWIGRFARDALKRAAEQRGLTQEQLADRLVPDLGLDADGSLTLDYGPRRFAVGFDEEIRPFVTDESGKPRKTLPKPGVKDDDVLAPAAYKRFTDLKKEARTVAAEQVKRLEAAMVTGRTWTAGEFGALFVAHPLMRHLARRLVWSAGTAAFRVAEDGTLADVRDDAFALPGDARVALPHPLVLGEDAVRYWAAIFADYEILQPFPQLGRPVHALAEDERGSGRLARFEGGSVHFGRILGLTSRGWTLGEKETGGFRRQVMLLTPDERHLMVTFEPGIRVFDPEEHAEQRIDRVMLLTGRYSGKPLAFGDLDPVTASEIIADLHRLTI